MAKSDKKTRKTFIIIGAFLIISLIIGVYFYSKKSEEKLSTITVKKINLQELIEVTGIIESNKTINIKSETNGKVLKLSIKENNFLKKDSTILKIDDTTLQLQLKQARINLEANKSNTKAEIESSLKILNEAKKRYKNNLKNLNYQIEKINSQIDFAKKEFNRNKKLFEQGAVNKKTVDDLEQNIEQSSINLREGITNLSKFKQDKTEIVNAENRYNQAKTNLRNIIKQGEIQIDLLKDSIHKTIIKAPFSGTVSSLDIEEGDYINMGSTIANMIDLKNIYLKLSLNELDIPKVKLTNKVKILFDAYPEKTFEGKVSFIGKASFIDNNNITAFLVKVNFEDKKELIKVGMSGDANIIVAEKSNVLATSIGSVFKENDKFFVTKVLPKNKLEKTEVEIGLNTIDDVEIISGLKEGDKILLEGKQEK